MKVLIVDDELMARKTITQLIEIFCPQIEEVFQASSIIEAEELIDQHSFDILLLDIQLKNETIFDLFERVDSQDFRIIFITAYNQFAIQAFKLSAIDYLLKPLDPDDFIAAIEKAESKIQQNYLNIRIRELLQNMQPEKNSPKRIVLNTLDSCYVVTLDNLIYCQADKSYTTFYLKDQQKITVSKSIGEYENILPKQTFLRCHQSYLVNMAFVSQFLRKKNVIQTTTGDTIPVSSRKKEQLLLALKSL